jgi:hypothetical protein
MGVGNYVIMTIMMLLVTLFPLSFLNYGRRVKVMDAYLGGANLQSSVRYRGSAFAPREVELRNYYLAGLLDEAKLARWGNVVGMALLVVMALVACI